MPFANPTNVILEPHGGTEGTSCRVVRVTTTGQMPLSNALDADRKKQKAVAETILEVLSRSPANLTENSVAQLAKSGNTIAAVTRANEHRGLNTTRAHKLVQARKRSADETS